MTKPPSQEKVVKDNTVMKTEVLRSLKYLFFASSAGLIQVLSFTFLNEVVFKGQSVQDGSTTYWISYLIALTLSVIWNFTFNRRYTFKSANNVPIAMLKIIGYYLIFTPLSTWWGDALTGIGWNEYIVLGGTMFINLLTEFTFCRFVVFKDTIDTNKIAIKEKDEDKGVAAEDKEEIKIIKKEDKEQVKAISKDKEDKNIDEKNIEKDNPIKKED